MRKSLKELIELATKENQNNESLKDKETLKESTNNSRKGFNEIEIDNDNGMTLYDYQYNQY